MLRNECGYKGAQPYWDWTLDSDPSDLSKFTSSPVFDPETGFGGNGDWVENDPTSWMPPVPGRTGGGCVNDGPWAGLNDVVHMGPANSTTLNEQCLKRDLAPEFAARYLNIDQTRLTLGMESYETFTGSVEGKTSFDESGVHGGGHYGVGGTFGMSLLPSFFFLPLMCSLIVSLRKIGYTDFCGAMNRPNGRSLPVPG